MFKKQGIQNKQEEDGENKKYNYKQSSTTRHTDLSKIKVIQGNGCPNPNHMGWVHLAMVKADKVMLAKEISHSINFVQFMYHMKRREQTN